MTRAQIQQQIDRNELEFQRLDFKRVQATNDGDWNSIQRLDGQMEVLKERTEQLRGILDDDDD